MKKLMLGLTILLSVTLINAESNYKAKYTQQVKVNIIQDNIINDLESDKLNLKNEIVVLKEKDKAQKGAERIFLNLTKDKVKGGVVTVGVLYISPWFAILYFI